MEVVTIIFTMCVLIFGVRAFIRYEPKLDLVVSNNKYILFFWYNEFDWDDCYLGRKYIKLFEI